MLYHEAQWFGRRLRRLGPDALSPMLNVGSSTARFRSREQPWIDRHVFQPAAAAHLKVVHTDMLPAEGVDLVGDLTDPQFLASLRKRRFRSVLCTHLLEHVPNRSEIADALLTIVEKGGYLLVSAPNQMPYHPYPIDTLFRPTPGDLVALFTGASPIECALIASDTYLGYLRRTPWVAFRTALLTAVPLFGIASWKSSLGHLPWWNRRFAASCVILRKDPISQAH